METQKEMFKPKDKKKLKNFTAGSVTNIPNRPTREKKNCAPVKRSQPERGGHEMERGLEMQKSRENIRS